MTFNELQKQSPALATLFKACGYSEQEATDAVKNWRVVKVDDGVRVEDIAPKDRSDDEGAAGGVRRAGCNHRV